MRSILVIGLGRFGKHVVYKLHELGYEVMAVDQEESRINDVLPFVTGAQIGDATEEGFLESLGVRNFDACIVAIGDRFQSSLETTLLLSELGAKKVISRASSDFHEKFLRRNGADLVVYPEKQLGVWAAIRCSSAHISDYFRLEGEYAIFEISIPSAWSGKTVGQLEIRKKYHINIMAVRKGKQLEMSVTPETLLEATDTLVVLGRDKDIQKCFHAEGLDR